MAPNGLSWPLYGVDVDVDLATRWWLDYPVKHFNRLSRAQDLHKEFVQEAFYKPAKLQRTASASRYEGCKEVQFDMPIRRSGSVSELSPSHALTYAQRNVDRSVPSYRSYRPQAKLDYYYNTLAPHNSKALLTYVDRAPLAPELYIYPRASDYRPELKSTLSRIYFEKKHGKEDYLHELSRVTGTWVGSRLRSLGYNLPFIYTTYDQGPINYGRFDRHVRSGNLFYGHAPRSVPRTYYRTVAPKYAYKPHRYYLSDRF